MRSDIVVLNLSCVKIPTFVPLPPAKKLGSKNKGEERKNVEVQKEKKMYYETNTGKVWVKVKNKQKSLQCFLK